MGRPDEEYEVVCDGGSLGNPGRGYGTFRWRGPREDWSPPVRLDLGDQVTNNEAEYLTLIRALEALLGVCRDPSATHLCVRTDSRLVVQQLKGLWKVRAANLVPLHSRARRLAGRFARVRYVWHPREESVALLGH